MIVSYIESGVKSTPQVVDIQTLSIIVFDGFDRR